MPLLAPNSSARTWTPKALLAVLAVMVLAIPSAGHDADFLVQQLKSESLSQTTRLLRDGQQYVFPTHGGMFDPTPGFEHVLANRRSLKLVEEIRGMSLSERTSFLDGEMTSLCDSFLSAANACLALPNSSASTDIRIGMQNSLLGLKGSMLTMLFAAAHTSDEETLASLLSQSDRLSNEVKKLADNSEGSSESMRRTVLRYRAPNREDIVNLIMHCRLRTGGFEELKDYDVPNSVERVVVRLGAWSERSNSHVVRPLMLPVSPDSACGANSVVIYRFCRGARTTDDVRISEDALERFDLAVAAFDFNAMCTRFR